MMFVAPRDHHSSPVGLSGRARLWAHGAVFLLLLLLLCGAAWRAGVFHGDFGTDNDEASHLMNGLLVRDYLLSGFQQAPIDYARDYYLHYPKIAIGMWGPVQPASLGLWTLLAGDSRVSVFLFMQVTAALVAFCAYLLALRVLPPAGAIVAGVLVALNPMILAGAHSVMADMLVALWAILCAAASARWMRLAEGRVELVLSILFATLGALTKPSGLALLAMPFTMIIVCRAWERLREPALWLALAGSAALILPWQYKSSQLVRSTVYVPPIGIPSLRHNVVQCWHAFGVGLGVVFGLLLLAGVWWKVVRPWLRGQPVYPVWAAAFALVACTFAFHVAQPFPVVQRHVALGCAGAMLLVCAGAAAVAERLPRWGTDGARLLMVLAVASAAFGMVSFSWHAKPSSGVGAAAEFLLSRPEYGESVFLVTGPPTVEGGFIGEVAIREKRPGHYALRGSKVLSSSSWDGQNYKLLFDTSEELRAELKRLPVGVLVLARTEPQSPEQAALRRMLQDYAAEWKAVGVFGDLELYEQKGHQAMTRGDIRIDVSYALSEVLAKRLKDRKQEAPPDPPAQPR